MEEFLILHPVLVVMEDMKPGIKVLDKDGRELANVTKTWLERDPNNEEYMKLGIEVVVAELGAEQWQQGSGGSEALSNDKSTEPSKEI